MLSCGTFNGSRDDLKERLRAENSLMKSRLALLQRENSVLKDENIQAKKEIQQLNAKIEKLNSDMLSSRERYEKDAALRENQYNSLETRYYMMEKETSAKIQELTVSNKNMETKFTLEIKQLYNNIKNQQDAFSKEREIIRNDRIQKETAMMKQIEELKNLLTDKENIIESQKTSLGELSIKLKESEKINSKTEKTLSNLEKENASLKEKLQISATASPASGNMPKK